MSSASGSSFFFELLTGALPLTVSSMSRQALDVLIAQVRATPRPTISARFSDLDPDVASAAANRRGEASPERLARKLAGRLRHLTGTALRLDKEHRFSSVAAFGRDIRHLLADEPFEEAAAEPVGRKLVLAIRRNPLLYAGAAAVLLSLIGGIAGTTWARGKAVEARDAEATQRALAISLAQDEMASRVLAEAETKRALRLAYAKRIALAAQLLQSADVAGVRGVLAECPTEFRRFEWYWLAGAADGSSEQLTTDSSRLVAVSLDGNRVAAVEHRTINVWTAGPEHPEPIVLSSHQDIVQSLSFSADGKRLLSASRDGEVRLWDPVSAKQLFTVRGRDQPERVHGSESTFATIDAAGRRVAALNDQGDVRLWEVGQGEEPKLMIRAVKPYSTREAIAISGDGSRLVFTDGPEHLTVWDVDRNEKILKILCGSSVSEISVNHDGSLIVWGGIDGVLRVWRPGGAPDEIVELRGHDHSVLTVGLSADGRYLVTGSRDNTVRVWDAEKGGEALFKLVGHEEPVVSVAITANGRRILTAAGDGVKVWDERDFAAQSRRAFGAYPRGMTARALNAGGNRIVTIGDMNSSIKVWDTRTGVEPLLTIQVGIAGAFSIAISENGRWLAVCGRDREIGIWDIESRDESAATIVQADIDREEVLAVSNDGQLVATADASETLLRLYDVSKLDATPLRFKRAEYGGKVYAATFSRDGRSLAWVDQGGLLQVRVVNYEDARLIAINAGRIELHPHRGTGGYFVAAALAFSPDARHLAAGVADLVKVWDIEGGGSILHTFRGHQGQVQSIDYSHDGSRLFSGGTEGSVKVWDADQAGDALLTLHGLEESGAQIAFNDADRQLISVCLPGSIMTWKASVGDEMVEMPRAHEYVGHLITTEGMVSGTHRHDDGTHCLEFDDDVENGLLIVLLDESSADSSEISRRYVGRTIRVSGSVESMAWNNDRPYINIRSDSQIEFLAN